MSCVGLDAYAYYNSAATDASPTWVEIDVARDVSTSSSADKAEVTDRRSKFKKYCPGTIDIETTITATYVQGNTAIDYLRAAYLARTPVQIAIVDGPLPPASGNTTEGFKYYAYVYSQDFDQPLTEGQTVSMTFAPCNSPSTDPGIEPSWYTVTTA